mmetsp:Transcript_25374/g.38788  ORF Transcript_25374/g.38788 Transcript_25374/m.38788 type:complete len:348 (-) Transcript_25374:389-1432(-)
MGTTTRTRKRTTTKRRTATTPLILLVFLFVILNYRELLVPKIEETHTVKITNTKVQVFYNLFIKGPEDEERVKTLVDEQLAYFDPEDSQYHEDILVTSIGHPLSNFTHGTIREHTDTGSEALTIHAIWEFCKANPHHEQKVVYLHSKGSYHDTSGNKRLRPFLTRGALSKECSNLPDKCNVCSSRMSPIPHPHTPGNMWLARCDYIAKLVDPTIDFKSEANDYPNQIAYDNPCKGWGRYFIEHWVHSHPSVRPCDLYQGNTFFYGYRNVPDETFEPELQMATERFPGGLMQGLYNGNICGNIFNGFTEVKDRIWQYDKLYHEKPDESWWGWKFYNVTFEDAKNSSIV